jgi:predicted Co/Zn/Cd cation transporter (cation efflux family)
MLRAALALLSTLQVGARIRESFERSLRQAIVIAIAAVLLLAAAVFALVAAYHALVSIYHFDPAEAAAIIAAGLLLVGLIVLAMVPLVGRQQKQIGPDPFVSTGDATGMIDQGVGNAMKQIGPVPLLAIAFIAGILAGRR